MSGAANRQVGGFYGHVGPRTRQFVRCRLGDVFVALLAIAYVLGIGLPMRMSASDLSREVEELAAQLEQLEDPDAEAASVTTISETDSAPRRLEPAALLPALIDAARVAGLRLEAVKQTPLRAGAEQPRRAQLHARGSFAQAIGFLDQIAAIGPALDVEALGLRREVAASAAPPCLEFEVDLALHSVEPRGSSAEAGG